MGNPLDCPGCGYDPMAPHNGKGDCEPPPRAERQRAADLEGRPERIEAVTRDLLADLEFYSG
ncbi:hypothetical protein SEA_CHIKPIC_60 [Microbacterium phage ChikPic]|nr:hypothetical protein SEA_CHIKPIC_60 [Microbacterium phage ChikPic]